MNKKFDMGAQLTLVVALCIGGGCGSGSRFRQPSGYAGYALKLRSGILYVFQTFSSVAAPEEHGQIQLSCGGGS
jgi:hypothetical protein